MPTTPSPRRRAAERAPARTDDRIIPATPADLAYVVGLQKRNHEALGFIPRVALAEKIDLGRIWLATENDEPAGFLHHGSLTVPEVRIFQAAIQYDARRRHHGLALVSDLLARAREAGARGVSLRCLDFLDANDFWTAAGFEKLGTEPGGRGTLNVWGTVVGANGDKGTRGQGGKGIRGAGLAFRFHSRIHPCPRCGAATTDTWTRGAIRHRLCPRCVDASER